MGGKGGGLLGGRGQGGKGKGKGAIVSETCGHLGGQGENGESPAVQSGRALPKGRCASPPCPLPAPIKCPPTIAYIKPFPSAPVVAVRSLPCKHITFPKHLKVVILRVLLNIIENMSVK